MRRLFATALIAMSAACVPLAYGGNQEEANRIAKNISAAYPQYTVEVAYKNGKVRLRGEVGSEADRQQITQMVSRIPNVQSVSADSIQIASGSGAVAMQPVQPSAQMFPAVPMGEQYQNGSAMLTAQVPAQDQMTGGGFANSVANTMSSEFNMGAASLETAPIQAETMQSMPAQNVSAPAQGGPVQGNVQFGTANPPAASGNYAPAPLTNSYPAGSSAYASEGGYGVQSGYGPAPQGIPVAAGQNGQNGEPNLPNYSWPTTADYPNYSQVGYPKQYAASAFPYIGPFYPYPQVPLGWRKVTMEWHDGYWWLDFNDGSVNGPFSPLFRQPTKYR